MLFIRASNHTTIMLTSGITHRRHCTFHHAKSPGPYTLVLVALPSSGWCTTYVPTTPLPSITIDSPWLHACYLVTYQLSFELLKQPPHLPDIPTLVPGGAMCTARMAM